MEPAFFADAKRFLNLCIFLSVMSMLGQSALAASPALLQSNSAQGAGVGSLSVPFPSNNTGGNLIVAFVRMSGTTQTVVVTDAAGNAYSTAVSQVQNVDGHQT